MREIPGSRRLSVQWDAGCSPPAPVAQGRHWSPPTASLFAATYSRCSSEFNCFPHVSCKTRKKIPLLPVHALNKHSVTIHCLLPFYCPSPPPLPSAFNLALARSVSLLLCLSSFVVLSLPGTSLLIQTLMCRKFSKDMLSKQERHCRLKTGGSNFIHWVLIQKAPFLLLDFPGWCFFPRCLLWRLSKNWVCHKGHGRNIMNVLGQFMGCTHAALCLFHSLNKTSEKCLFLSFPFPKRSISWACLTCLDLLPLLFLQ